MSKRIYFQDVAKNIMKKYQFKATNDNETLYIYSPELGIYTDRAETFIQEQAQKLLGDESQRHLLKEVITFITNANFIDREQFNSSENLVCVKNGILNLETRELSAHSSEHLFLNQIPINFDKDATCPKFDKFLREIVNPPYDKMLIQFLGFLLITEYLYKKYITLVGTGDNGKSVFLNTVTQFIGKKNVSNFSLQDLSTDKNAIALLYGKRANIYADLPSESIKYPTMLKNLTGRDDVRGRKLYENFFDFKNKAKLIFSCNTLPNIENMDDAFYQRNIIIPFPNQFKKGSNMDEYLLEKLTTEKELSGILNLALKGRAMIMAEHGFDCSDNIQDIKKQFILHSNDDVAKYANNRLVIDPDSYVEKIELYKDYMKFQEENNEVYISENVFHPHLKKMLSITEQYKRFGKEQKRIWLGIRIRHSDAG